MLITDPGRFLLLLLQNGCQRRREEHQGRLRLCQHPWRAEERGQLFPRPVKPVRTHGIRADHCVL